MRSKSPVSPMGCVYSNHSSKKKPNNANGDLTANGNGPTSSDSVRWNNTTGNGHGANNNDNNNNQSATRNRIFDVEVCNVDKDGTTVIHGKIEITDNNLIYRLKGRSPIIWPLRFLRSYGHDKDIFSFECGRRCPTGEGVYVFKCSNAELLFKTLLEAINNATNLNSSNIAINNQLSGTLSHSIASSSNNAAHEYQNLSPFDNEHGNFGTLPSRISPTAAAAELINRPHSSMSSEQANHTYLNSAGHNVIGSHSKSQPNYYTSNPLSCQSCQLEGSKTSLNGTLAGKVTTCYDSSTLPPMRGTKNAQHEYVNSNVYINSSLDDSFMSRRKSSEQHLYENHEIPFAHNSRTTRKLEHVSSRMTGSDDLSTFCYVNLDLESRKERQAYLQGYKNKSARTTPEPKLSYIQLDLKSKEAKSQMQLPLETIHKKESNKNGIPKEKSIANAEPSKVRHHSIPSTATAGGTAAGFASSEDGTRESGGSNKEQNAQDQAKASTTVPYAQIDFAKTLALSNSAANHRKL